MNSRDPKFVFIFGGQGLEWYSMGRQLIQNEVVFKDAIFAVSDLVKVLGQPWSLFEELMASEDESKMAESSVAQLTTFAVQYATAELLKSWRLHPAAVLGQSLGECAAACVAGIITLKEAVHLVLIRSTLQDECPKNGRMAAVGMSEDQTRKLLSDLQLSVSLSITAVNDPTSVTVAGDSQSVNALGQYLKTHAKNTFWRVFGTKRAFHSPHMDIIQKPFKAAMRQIKLNPRPSKIPVYSTVEGKAISGEMFNSDYWWRNIRCPVQLHSALKHMLEDGFQQVIEISTQPMIAYHVKQIAVQENLGDQQEWLFVLATLPRKTVPVKEQHEFFLLNTVCRLHTLGFTIDWSCVNTTSLAKMIREFNYSSLEKTSDTDIGSLKP